jgi:hypothetical protein
MREAVCYGVQEPLASRDLSSAQRYGRVEFLLDGRDKPSLTPGPCLRKIYKGLQDMHPDDYIFYAGGDPMGLLLVGAVLRDQGFSEINFLKWDRETDPDTGERVQGAGYYIPQKVKLRMWKKETKK